MGKNKEKTATAPIQADKYDGLIAVFKNGSDSGAYAKFNAFHNLRFKWIQNIISFVLVAICGLLALLTGRTYLGIGFFVLSVAFPFIVIGLQYISVSTRLSGDLEFKNTTHEYRLGEVFTAITKCGKREAKADVTYGEIKAVYERKDVYYVYVSNRNAFVLIKSGLAYGNVNEVNALFSEKLQDNFHSFSRGK